MLRMGYNEKLARRRHAKGDQPFLTFRMVGVGTRHCQEVIENTRSLLKRNPMLVQVLRSLGRVPLKMHSLILSFEFPKVYLLFRLTWIKPVLVGPAERDETAGGEPS